MFIFGTLHPCLIDKVASGIKVTRMHLWRQTVSGSPDIVPLRAHGLVFIVWKLSGIWRSLICSMWLSHLPAFTFLLTIFHPRSACVICFLCLISRLFVEMVDVLGKNPSFSDVRTSGNEDVWVAEGDALLRNATMIHPGLPAWPTLPRSSPREPALHASHNF